MRIIISTYEDYKTESVIGNHVGIWIDNKERVSDDHIHHGHLHHHSNLDHHLHPDDLHHHHDHHHRRHDCNEKNVKIP